MGTSPATLAHSLEESYALIYAPRRHRDRFPENCVQLMDSLEAAREGADPERNLHPARVRGPFRSSEGFKLYYLLNWLG